MAVFSFPEGSANAQRMMKVYGDQWEQAKAPGKTNGETWRSSWRNHRSIIPLVSMPG
jgi:hypothetical protein